MATLENASNETAKTAETPTTDNAAKPAFKTIECKATVNFDDDRESIKVGYDLPVGDTLQDLVEIYGEDIVGNYAVAQLKVRAQAVMRAEVSKFFDTEKEGGVNPEGIASYMSEWKPDVSRVTRKDPKEKILQSFASLSPEEREKILAQLREQASLSA